MRLRAAILLALGLSAVSVIALCSIRRSQTSDQAMRAHFLAHRADFERLVVMANEDTHLIRIAPDFTWLDDDSAWPRKNVGFSEQRWNDYRQIFRRVGAIEGILNYNHPTLILVPIVSTGLVPSGANKGLAYSQTALSPLLKSLDQEPPDNLKDGSDHTHMRAFKPIDNNWYIYYEEW